MNEDSDPPGRIGRGIGRAEAAARVAAALEGLGLNGDVSKVRRSPALHRALALMEEQILDPRRPERELADILTIDEHLSRPFAPVLQLDPRLASPALRRSFGDVLKDHANELTRRRRQTLFRKRLEAGEKRPILVAEGDSWFHFPIFLRDIVQQLGADHLIWSVGAAGEQLASMVEPNEPRGERDYRRALREYAGDTRALLLSGGGNDLVGADPDGTRVLTLLARRYEPGRTASWFIDTPEFHRRLVLIEASLRRVFADVEAHHPGVPVLIHGYDYALPWPSGDDDERRPSWTKRDGYLGRTLVELGFRDIELRTKLVRCLIDELNAIQRKLAGGTNPLGAFAHVFHVDLRGTLGPNQWADELHPSDQGYAIVAERFRAQLRALGVGTG
jgi:hypothetical protein